MTLKLEKNISLQLNESLVFHELEIKLINVSFEKIYADSEDENIPDGEAVNVNLHLFLENKKKKITFSILSEPYESIRIQTWKSYKFILQKTNSDSIKMKIEYNGD